MDSWSDARFTQSLQLLPEVEHTHTHTHTHTHRGTLAHIHTHTHTQSIKHTGTFKVGQGLQHTGLKCIKQAYNISVHVSDNFTLSHFRTAVKSPSQSAGATMVVTEQSPSGQCHRKESVSDYLEADSGD